MAHKHRPYASNVKRFAFPPKQRPGRSCPIEPCSRKVSRGDSSRASVSESVGPCRGSDPSRPNDGGIDRLKLRRHLLTAAEVRCCGQLLGCDVAIIWRGWMGIEPTQGASTAPRKRF